MMKVATCFLWICAAVDQAIKRRGAVEVEIAAPPSIGRRARFASLPNCNGGGGYLGGAHHHHHHPPSIPASGTHSRLSCYTAGGCAKVKEKRRAPHTRVQKKWRSGRAESRRRRWRLSSRCAARFTDRMFSKGGGLCTPTRRLSLLNKRLSGV